MRSKSIHQDVYISVFIYAVLIFLFTASVKLPDDSASFPIILIVALALLNTSVFVKGLKKSKFMTVEGSTIKNSITWEVIKLPLITFLLVVGYVAIFTLTNYYIATAVFLIAMFLFYKIKSWKVILLVTLLFNILIYLGFGMFLNVPLL